MLIVLHYFLIMQNYRFQHVFNIRVIIRRRRKFYVARSHAGLNPPLPLCFREDVTRILIVSQSLSRKIIRRVRFSNRVHREDTRRHTPR